MQSVDVIRAIMGRVQLFHLAFTPPTPSLLPIRSEKKSREREKERKKEGESSVSVSA